MVREEMPLKMLAGLLALGARHVVGIISGLLMIPLVVRSLGADGLGAWALMTTLAVFVGFADLGLPMAVQRAAARSDDAAMRRLFRMTVLVIAILCPLACAGAYVLLLRLLSGDAAFQADVALAAPLALGGGLVGAFTSPMRSVLMMRGAFTPLAWGRAASAASQVLLTALGLIAARSLVVPAGALLASATLETAILARACRLIDPYIDFRPGWSPERPEVRDAFRQGAAVLVINVGAYVAIRADVVILAPFAALSVVGAYQVASRVIDQIYTFAKQVSGWLLHRMGDSGGRPDAVRLGTAIMGGLVASGVVALALDGPALLAAWAGPIARSEVTLLAVGLLGAAVILAATQELAASALTVGSSTAWHAAIPITLGNAGKVVVSLVAVRLLGAWGVAVGTVCGNLLTAVLVWVRARGLLGWRGAEVFWTLAPLGSAVLVSLGAGWALAPLAAKGAVASGLACCGVTALGIAATFLTWWWRHGATRASMAPAAGGEPPPAG